MWNKLFSNKRTNRDTIHHPSQWRDLGMVILVTGFVAVAIADKDFRQPFYVVAGSILSTQFVAKNSGSKQ